MKNRANCVTIEDVLLSPETAALIVNLRLHGALQHVRAFGAKLKQRMRGRMVFTRDTTTFVQTELEDKDGNVTKTLVLVEDFWNRLAEGENGAMIAGQMDTQAAIGEIEARLRSDPTMADMQWMEAAGRSEGKSAPAAGQAAGNPPPRRASEPIWQPPAAPLATTPATPAPPLPSGGGTPRLPAPATPVIRREEPKEMPVHEIQDDSTEEQPSSGGKPGDGRHEVPLESGIPLEIFHEYEPTQPVTVTPQETNGQQTEHEG